MSETRLRLPVKLNDAYTCQGTDAGGRHVVFDDLLGEGERVATLTVGDGDDAQQFGPYGVVARREDGLWVEPEDPEIEKTQTRRRLGQAVAETDE